MILARVVLGGFIGFSLYWLLSYVLQKLTMIRDQIKFYDDITAQSKASFASNKEVFDLMCKTKL